MTLFSIAGLTLLSSLARGKPQPEKPKGKPESNTDFITSTDDAQAATDRVSFDFMGASGGMKIQNVDDQLPDRWVMLQQDKLEELTASGVKVS